MKNIMKSILYEIVRSKMLIRIFLLFIVVQVLLGILNINTGSGESTVSYMVADMGVIVIEFPMFILAIIVGTIVGEDYRDKVANYEVMSGHSRKSIFLTRSLMAILVSSLLCTVLTVLPILSGLAISQWGTTLVLKDVIIRYLLLFFPFLRLAAFFACLTFLVKNNYVMLAVGFGMMNVSTILTEMMHNNKNIFISIFNFKLLTSFDGWSIYNVDPEAGVVYYNSYISSLSPKLVIGTVIASLLMTVFYLFLGYALFRRDELN